MTKKEKSRYFTFLLYPESIPNDWELRLETLGFPIAISPLHDRDKKEDQEKGLKKPHYHVIYVTPNPVTAHSVKMRIKRLLGDNSLALVQIVSSSMENMYLYLTHESKDAIAKNKYTYNKSDIKLLNNFDIDRYIVVDRQQQVEIEKTILNIIYHNHLENIFDFMDFYYEHKDEYDLPNESNLFSILKSNSGILRMFFDGAYQTNQRKIMMDEQKRTTE